MRLATISILIASAVGCSSIHTTPWSRATDDSLHRDTNKCLKGIPVMLKVPSHLEVKVLETLYAAHDPDTHQLKVVKLARRDYDVDAQLKYTEKMFLVDPQRVGAGTGSYGFDFATPEKGTKVPNSNGTGPAGHGYLRSMAYKADDHTIEKGADLLSTVLSFGAKSDPQSPQNSNFVEIQRVVAFERFDLAEECVDQKVMGFIDVYFNRYHQPELGFDPEARERSVAYPHRVPDASTVAIPSTTPNKVR